jgi:threonine/homoserine/homoserine lactone efflux protein
MIPLIMTIAILAWCLLYVLAPLWAMLIIVTLGLYGISWMAWKMWRVERGHFMSSDANLRRRLYNLKPGQGEIVEGQEDK